MNILLIGNPNVGKSAIFSHLTGISVTTSNYPGTTVQYSKGYMSYKETRYNVIDVPGTYQLNPEAEAEKVAVDMINSGDVLVNVVDATNLERNLNLTLQLMELGKPVILVLNMWDDAKHKGIEIDTKRLEKHLKIPVIPTNGLTGEGLNLVQEKISTAQPIAWPKLLPGERWETIGRIVSEVQNLSHRHHTFMEALQDLAIHPWFGPPIAILILFIVFKVIISIGNFLTGFTTRLFEVFYAPLILGLSSLIGGKGLVHSLLIGEISAGGIDFEGAMGVLTTGVFVALGIVLPYIILFYAFFGFLEDLGYLPRVAVILDRFLHKIGLHGYSVIPMLLGCGCNVPGILAVKNLETRRERFITAILTCVTIPCMAQTALIIKAVGARGSIYLGLTLITLITVWTLLGLVLKRVVGGSTPTLLMEIPPYRLPNIKLQMKKLFMRISCFLKEAIPYVLGGILLINLLHTAGVIGWIGRLFSPVIKGVFGLPEETVAALIIGTLRKDAAVALLEPIGLGDLHMVIAVVVLTLYFPCVATFTVLLKELGIRDMVKAVAIMFITTMIVGGGLNMAGKVFRAASFAPYLLMFFELLLIAFCVLIGPKLIRLRNKRIDRSDQIYKEQ
ncbi:MAG: ferrous iron transporter B [Firmicutes bacterium]|nr:ferrous iron transporter B [Bacillota bacterium]